jgi:hypothetical protein
MPVSRCGSVVVPQKRHRYRFCSFTPVNPFDFYIVPHHRRTACDYFRTLPVFPSTCWNLTRCEQLTSWVEVR